MGLIGRKLAIRLRKSRKAVQHLSREAKQLQASIRLSGELKDAPAMVKDGYDPIHAAYIAGQNFTASFGEAVSGLDEFDAYCRIVGAAQETYMPGGPPMSPLTHSYFTTWAFFDCRFGPDHETIGTCLLDVASILGLDAGMVEIIRLLQASRMGFYEHCGTDGAKCRLRELVTNREFTCYPTSGYQGHSGELWYVRLCPPPFDLVDYYVVFTTPYVLLGAARTDWIAYLNRALVAASGSNAKDPLRNLLKYGADPNSWNAFILEAYHHHQSDAIFLAGLPDVKGSRPHAS